MSRIRAGVRIPPWSPRCLNLLKTALILALPILAVFAVLGVDTPAGAASTTVTEKNNPTFGTILADSAGKTLYTLTNNGSPVLCAGVCAQVWPPLTVPPGTAVTGPPGVCCLGSTPNANGDAVTYKGDPLYRYVNDSSPSDATGDGVMSFGGTWHVVRVSASSASTTTTAPSATTTTVATTPPTTSQGTPTAASAPATSVAAAPLGSPGTGGTPPRSSDVGLLVGIGALVLGLGFAAAAIRRRRGET